MSNIYIQEPPTNGKVLLKTTNGDIDIELWSKEAPKACRNFVQLCLEGYYDNSIFHRIIKGFIVQGGDPTGTGEGGQSIYGQAFKDEFHSRLKFARRGLVAMANAGPNDNASQFFFTLDRCEHLNSKHTIFGKVTGNTVFNMLKLGEVETDGEDRPLYPPKIKTTEVLANPFEDIEPRDTKKNKDDKEKKKKSKVKGTKNFSLLSFGEEAEEDEVETKQASEKMRNRSKSAHDLTRDRSLSSAPAIPKSPPSQDSKRKRLFSGEDGTLSSPEGMQPSADDAGQKVKKHKGEMDDAENLIEDEEKSGNEQIGSQELKNTDSERTSKDGEEARKADNENSVSDKKSRWDKIPENLSGEPLKPDKREQSSDGVVKKLSQDEESHVAEKSTKKGSRDLEMASERKEPESRGEDGDKRGRESSDMERRTKKDHRESDRIEKKDSRDGERSERKQSPTRGHKSADRTKSPTRSDNKRDSERDIVRGESKQTKSPTQSDNRKDGGRDGSKTESKQSRSPNRSENRKDGSRDGGRTDHKQSKSVVNRRDGGRESKSPMRSDNRRYGERDGARTERSGRLEKKEKKDSHDGKDRKDARVGKDGQDRKDFRDAKDSHPKKESRDLKDGDKGKNDKDNEDYRRSRSSSNSSTKKESDRGSSDKSSRKDGSSGETEKESSQNGGSQKKETRITHDDKEHKLSRKEQIRRELENLDRELQETRRKRKEKRKMEETGDVVGTNQEAPPSVEPAPTSDDKESSIVDTKQPKENDSLDEFRIQKKKFKQLKKQQVRGESREAQTLALLAKFQKKLHTAISEKPEEKEQGEVVEDEEEEEETQDDNKEGEDVGLHWAVNSLRFEDHGPTLAKDANVEGADTFDIFDPRNPMTKRRREESKRKSREERKGRR